MFESIIKFFKKIGKQEKVVTHSKDAAKERLHLVLMQDRANVSADFLDLMKQEIIEVIKKYIDVDENEIDVRLANRTNEDGTTGAPALYANIPIISIKEEAKKEAKKESEKEVVKENEKKELSEEIKEETVKEQKQEVQKEEETIAGEKEKEKEEKEAVQKTDKEDEEEEGKKGKKEENNKKTTAETKK